MTRLRVGFLLGRLNPGGSERQMLALARHLPRERFAVDFLSLGGEGLWDDQAAVVGAGLIHVGSRPESLGPLALRWPRRALKASRYIDVVRAVKYDIIDAWLYPTDVFAVATRSLTRTPVVLSGRRNVDPHDLFGPLDHLFDAVIARFADAVIANSSVSAEYARRQGIPARKLKVIRNGVEALEPLTDHERSAVRADFGVSDDQLVVASVANFHRVKGHAVLLEAFASLIRERDDLRLVLVGDGPLRSEIESTIRDLGLDPFVRLLGAVSDPRRLYEAFDVVVQTSIREGLPNAMLEAAASRRAMVATMAGATSEIIRDGQTGLLVPIEDVGALMKALRRCLSDSAFRARLGEAAGELVTNEFGMERFVHDYAALYESMVMGKRGSQPGAECLRNA